MFPISDDNPTVSTPWVTIVILAVTAVVWVLVQGAGFDVKLLTSICNLGMVPAELTGTRPVGFRVPMAEGLYCVVDNEPVNWLTPITSMFLHGGWGHVIGNLWFLWVFGNNVEDAMGPARFVTFYLLCGVIAAAAHLASSPGSPIPTVGASGAISGIMGAYLVLYPRARVNLLFWIVIFVRVIPVPAWVALLGWFGLQLFWAVPAAGPEGDMGGGVAFWAHIGGFIAGVVLVRLFARRDLLDRKRQLHDEAYALSMPS